MMLRKAFACALESTTTIQRQSLYSRAYATGTPVPTESKDPEMSTTTSTIEKSSPPKLQGNPDLLALLDAEDGTKISSSAKREEYKSSADRKRERMANIFLGVFAVGAFGGVLYLGAESEESTIKGYSPNAWYNRVKERFTVQVNYYTEPAFAKLLPDPLPEPYQRRYTLVLDLDDLLIHSEWTRDKGWRTAKRPGLDYFLSYLSQYYEIVVFTNQYAGTALPIIQKLDPYRSSLSASLFRESAKYDNGKFIKDLSYMNRPLERIVLIDTNPDAICAQPENSILLKPWLGETGPESNAKELLAHLPFLEWLAAVEVADVRQTLKTFEGTDIPTEYLKREQELRDKILASRAASPRAGFFGGRKNASQKVEIFMDQQRARAQQAHQEYMTYLKENGEKMLREEKEREEELLKGMKTSVLGYFTQERPNETRA